MSFCPQFRAFGELKVGDLFFDPFSGEDYRKINGKQARCESGGDAFEGEIDEFEPNEQVEIHD